MKQTLLITLLLMSVSTELIAQQINFGGNRVMHMTGTRNVFLGLGTGGLSVQDIRIRLLETGLVL